jgi:nitrogen fixation/metabolism regulation signal transduction histidine kinase
MIYKHFYPAIIFRLTIFALASACSVWFYNDQSYVLMAVSLLFLMITAINIFNYFNRVNEWMKFFITGIENEDTGLKIPEKSGNKNIDALYKSMDRLNNLLQKTKIEISAKEHYFRSIINKSNTGLFSVNESGRIENINPAANKLTGLQEYFHINSLSNIDKSLPGFILRASEKKQQSAIFENKYGQKLNFNLSEINIDGEKYILVAVNDISKELDSREVDAWIKLARTLAHEIMNNITPITTLSKVISGYFMQNEKIIEAENITDKTVANTIKGLNIIEERSLALMNFVQNYRKFTKLPQPDIQNINLSDILENSITIIKSYPNSEKIKILKNIPSGIFIYSDDKLISQVIINILKNAYEALINKESIEQPSISISLKKSGNNVSIEISDNGNPIPNEIKEQIFVPFYTTKEKGSGIGLSLSKQILLQMNGDIVLKKSDKQLTTFVIRLKQ